jgi:hypothetical protein
MNQVFSLDDQVDGVLRREQGRQHMNSGILIASSRSPLFLPISNSIKIKGIKATQWLLKIKSLAMG